MLEGLRQLFLPRPLLQVAIDLLDIFLVAYLVYRVLLVLRGTRAMQMGIGLLFVGGIYVVARFLGLVTLVTLLSTLLSSIILVVVVVFQNDLRRALMRAGRPLLGGLTRTDESKVIEEVVAAASELARLRYGAIITWERDANLEEFIVGAGTQLDAVVTRELLVSIFIPVGENKLHDGSVIIRNLRLAQAGVFFPMPEKLNLDKKFGSRHRAALGITADTDAVAVVVSEERGTIMFCFQENHVDNVTPETLRNLLRNYETKTKKKTIKTGAPASQRRSLPPPPTSMRTPPSSAPATQPEKKLGTGTGPVVMIKTPPPGLARVSELPNLKPTQKMMALTPPAPSVGEGPKSNPRPEVVELPSGGDPDVRAALDSPPPDEGTDQ
ncbi:MAG: diadenylate cyclase [Polyangiales bacterium]